ncbi:MAG: type VI secretion system baseplate subunit TssK [Planctomycetes bacterium]|nr:type VI secretion system baseplate subunit TssK [Planctomycetota bacterium]
MPGLFPEIHWDDGLLLRPQHLQAFQRHCQGLVSQLTLARPFGFGVRRLEIREDSIGNFVFEVAACEIVMPDGSLVVAGETATLPPLEFRHLESDAPRLDVWLAIPLLVPNAPNVEQPDGGSEGSAGRRFVLDAVDVPDENTGGRAQSVGVKRLNVRLFVGQRPPQGHVTLKIAELEKRVSEGTEGRTYTLSKAFVPACLRIEASPVLHRVVKDVRDRVEEKNAELLGHLRGRRDLLTGESAERPETLLKLQATNAILPVLRQLAAQDEMHPFDVFMVLCRLVGDLAIFGDTWEPPKLSVYKHTEPATAFADLRAVVLDLLEAAVQTGIERREFAVKDAELGILEAELPPAFLKKGATLLLGLETKRSLDEVAPMFTNGRTVLSAPEEISMVRRARIDGVPCRPDPALHPSLKDRPGIVFLRIRPEGDFWPAVGPSGRLSLAGEAVDGSTRFYVYCVGGAGN